MEYLLIPMMILLIIIIFELYTIIKIINRCDDEDCQEEKKSIEVPVTYKKR